METIYDSRSFGKRFRQERKALGKTQSDVAKSIGVRRQTIADLEKGENVGSHVLFAALRALNKNMAVTEHRRPTYEEAKIFWEEFDHG